MQPTYSFSEIKLLLKSLDINSLNILSELIDDDEACYKIYELKAIRKILQIVAKVLVQNEVKMEFLLSFN